MVVVVVLPNLIACHVFLAIQIALHDVVCLEEFASMVSHIHIGVLLAHDFRLADGIEGKGYL